MSEESIKEYLDDVQAEAWSEHIYPRPAVGSLAAPPMDGAFIRAARVYERELRRTAEERVMTVRVADESLQAASKARDVAYEMLSQLVSGPEREDVLRIVAELDKVLGPDLVREADPTGEVLKPLPFDERKRMLDVLDRVQEVVDARGSGQPPLIIVVEDEMGPLLEKARQMRRGEGE
jgi:hypothetical protein